jgi:hypothetical protein
MWALVLLLNLAGRKNFVRFLAGWVLIMVLFLYCFVHDAFDQSTKTPRVVVPRVEHRPVASIPENQPGCAFRKDEWVTLLRRRQLEPSAPARLLPMPS